MNQNSRPPVARAARWTPPMLDLRRAAGAREVVEGRSDARVGEGGSFRGGRPRG